MPTASRESTLLGPQALYFAPPLACMAAGGVWVFDYQYLASSIIFQCHYTRRIYFCYYTTQLNQSAVPCMKVQNESRDRTKRRAEQVENTMQSFLRRFECRTVRCSTTNCSSALSNLPDRWCTKSWLSEAPPESTALGYS
ncbi:hypothetical protein SCHPADRAFT_244714 [Schizopora paradoxa]|uniref:Uncharacterized protein n=1 Tax=Schizopora paradoxa TaxID=27342 RepID=A0A0H2SFF9_9AGAM|nr:hypothetical protein SCHPADRAFT_244714 [Schizopora paradoxa]